MAKLLPPITGSGGGTNTGGSGGGGGGSKFGGGKDGGTQNTLRSKARARLVDLISEGALEAVLVDGAKSIYFDETPIQDDETDAYNFEGVTFDTRSGLPDQTHLKGVTQVETPFSVDVRVKKSVSPPVRTINDPDADACRVIVRLPSLLYTDREDGKIQPTSVSYAFDVRPSGGDWTQVVLQNIVDEKTTSPYEKAHRFELPDGGNPWDIRMRRITDDSEEAELQNETYWASYFVITEGKFIYPNSAMVALEVDSELFGNSLPQRRYHVKGIKVSVPVNYNQITRVYTGIWNGTFKTAWTNNPAWILYDLLVNDRYGLGEHIEVAHIDKWGLYQIAQYCDEMVPSGRRDGEGEEILEPRFTFNGVINNRAQAFDVLRMVATAFRGMAYWSLNQVVAVADMPSDPVKLVAPANVHKGVISYSGSGRKARHSVAIVQFNDPDDFDRPALEVYIDDEALKQFGWRETSLQAVGCRSRGQARRMAKWALYTERFETEVATYEASWDHADVRPGQIIAIADPAKAEVRNGGRIYAIDGTEVTLDAPFEPGDGETYSLMVQMPDGQIETRAITWVEDPPEGFENRVVELASVFSQDVQKGAMWAITGTDVAPRQFRVLSVTESEPHLFRITAALHVPAKYDLIEQGIDLPDPAYARPTNGLSEPTTITLDEALYFNEGSARTRLTLSWASPTDFMTSHYHVTALAPTGQIDFGPINGVSIDIPDASPGQWKFYLQSVGKSGLRSRVAEKLHTVRGWEGVQAPYVSHLESFGGANSLVFGGRNARVVWRNNFPGSAFDWGTEPSGAGSGNTNPFYRHNVVKVYDADTLDLLRTDIVQGETYTYTYEHNVEDNELLGEGPKRNLRFAVTIRDHLGRESSPAYLTLENPVPPQLNADIEVGLDTLNITYEVPDDIDFAGALVWVSTSPGIDPDEDVPTYHGPSNSITIPVTPFETYYVRIAGYDSFGTQGLIASTEISATPGGDANDVSAPDIPTNLITAAQLVLQPDGTLQSVLTAIWDESPSDNFGLFEIEIREEGGSYISYATNTARYEWRGLPFNTTYEIRVRAVSRNGFPSGYTAVEEQLIPANTTAPGAPSGLAGLASVRSVFLSWTNPVDTDLAAIEIWSHTANDRAGASLVGTSRSSAFTHSGLTTGVTRYYWIRAVNTSGLQGAFNAGDTSGVAITPGEVDSDDIAADAILAEHILAGEITGDHISVTADLAPTITIDGTGISLGDMTEPADLVNAQSTQIQPGKILISGGTSLADWRNGSDATKIEGGAIAANTIVANLVTVGLRGLDIAGIQFQANSPSSNRVAWSAGVINYTNDSGANASASITASNVLWSSGTVYIYWVKAATTLSTSTTRPTGADDVILATYRGGTDLVVTYGRTVVDGDHIVADTIIANHIVAGSVTTAKIDTDAVTQIQHALTAGSITVDNADVVQTVAMTRTASTTLDIMLAFEVDPIEESDNDTIEWEIQVEIRRGSTTLQTWNFLLSMINYAEPGGIINYGGPMSLPWIDTANVSGSQSYTVRLSVFRDGSQADYEDPFNPFDPDRQVQAVVRNRYLRLLERKR